MDYRREGSLGRALLVLVAALSSGCEDVGAFDVRISTRYSGALVVGEHYPIDVYLDERHGDTPAWYDEFEVKCSDGCEAKVLEQGKGLIRLDVSRPSPGWSNLEVVVTRHRGGHADVREGSVELTFAEPVTLELIEDVVGPVAAHGALVGAELHWCAYALDATGVALVWPDELLSISVAGAALEITDDRVEEATGLPAPSAKLRCLDLLAAEPGVAQVTATLGALKQEGSLRVVAPDEVTEMVAWVAAPPLPEARWQPLGWDPLLAGTPLASVELAWGMPVSLAIQLLTAEGASVLAGAGLVAISPESLGTRTPPWDAPPPQDQWWLSFTPIQAGSGSLELALGTSTFSFPVAIPTTPTVPGFGGTPGFGGAGGTPGLGGAGGTPGLGGAGGTLGYAGAGGTLGYAGASGGASSGRAGAGS